MTLHMIGIGLNDEKDITLKGLEKIKASDKVYLESYTSVLQCSKEALEKLEKDGKISKDDLARAEKELEKVTGEHTNKIDEMLKHKEAELLEV